MDGRQAERHSLRDAIKTKKREVAQLAAQLEEEQSEEQELAAQARELAAANADVAAELQQSTQQQVGGPGRCAAGHASTAAGPLQRGHHAAGTGGQRRRHVCEGGWAGPSSGAASSTKRCSAPGMLSRKQTAEPALFPMATTLPRRKMRTGSGWGHAATSASVPP